MFCLTDHSIAGYASAGSRPIAQRQRASKQWATHEIFRLGNAECEKWKTPRLAGVSRPFCLKSAVFCWLSIFCMSYI